MKKKIRDMEFNLRGLTRGELRDLEADGIDLDNLPRESEKALEIIDRVLSLAAPDLDLMKLSPAECHELFLDINRMTYLGEGEIKKFAELLEKHSKAASAPAARVRKRGSRSTGGARK